MAGNKYLEIDATTGLDKERAASQTSAGAGDAGNIVALNSSGLIDSSMLGLELLVVEAFEALAAGDFVNLFDDGGTIKARKANASVASAAKTADGFVLSAYAATDPANVYREGVNDQVSGQTVGARVFLSGTVSGAATATIATTAGYSLQRLGKALSATSIEVEIAEATLRA